MSALDRCLRAQQSDDRHDTVLLPEPDSPTSASVSGLDREADVLQRAQPPCRVA
jgi:hypothetical protein